MVSKLYFEETFSIATAQALQVWAQTNLIAVPDGNYGMRISYIANAPMFAETEITDLTIGRETTLRIDVKDAESNGGFAITVNELANDNSSSIAEIGYGIGQRTMIFTPTAETMYLAVGMETTCPECFVIVDNVTTSVGTIVNGTFEDGTTTGWYGQSANATLEAYEYNVEPPISGDNPYLEPVNIPIYDSGNPKHFLVPDDGGLTKANLENTAYTNYYVRPGNHQEAAAIEINRRGTAIAPLTISLHNDDDLHPRAIYKNDGSGVNNIAQVALRFRNSSYWVVDRMASVGTYYQPMLTKLSDHIVINRYFSETEHLPALFGVGSHYITIQNSRIQGWKAGDGVGMNIYSGGSDYIEPDGTKHYTALYNKFIRNEVVDQNDGFQVTVNAVGTNYEYCNVGGLIVNDNDFWLEGSVLDRENATDTKGGSPDPLPDAAHDNPIDNPPLDCVISGNRCWGYNGIYQGAGESGQADMAIIASMHSNGYKIYDNIIFDSVNSIAGGSNAASTGLDDGRVDTEIYNNISYRCGNEESPVSYKQRYNVREGAGRGLNMHDSYFIEPRSIGIGYFSNCRDNSAFSDNKVVDPLPAGWEVLIDDEDPENPYTGTPCDQDFKDSLTSNPTVEVSRTGFTDYVFTKNKFTESPELVRISAILDPNGTIVSPVDPSLPADEYVMLDPYRP